MEFQTHFVFLVWDAVVSTLCTASYKKQDMWDDLGSIAFYVTKETRNGHQTFSLEAFFGSMSMLIP